jgi:hypothetical protein
MQLKFFCDICKGEVRGELIRVGIVRGRQYCARCWHDRRNWARIHALPLRDATKVGTARMLPEKMLL